MVFSELTIGDFLEKMVEKDPDQEFMVYPDRDLRFTYQEFDERVNLMAKGLLGIGIKKETTWVSGLKTYQTGSLSCSPPPKLEWSWSQLTLLTKAMNLPMYWNSQI
ncbi:hypothetical protein GCM10025860_16400 [Methanobacterium ferruginis]|nr:hypothetical protein GCM10025860_16400 [Methanobacterium ferruginis]